MKKSKIQKLKKYFQINKYMIFGISFIRLLFLIILIGEANILMFQIGKNNYIENYTTLTYHEEINPILLYVFGMLLSYIIFSSIYLSTIYAKSFLNFKILVVTTYTYFLRIIIAIIGIGLFVDPNTNPNYKIINGTITILSLLFIIIFNIKYTKLYYFVGKYNNVKFGFLKNLESTKSYWKSDILLWLKTLYYHIFSVFTFGLTYPITSIRKHNKIINKVENNETY